MAASAGSARPENAATSRGSVSPSAKDQPPPFRGPSWFQRRSFPLQVDPSHARTAPDGKGSNGRGPTSAAALVQANGSRSANNGQVRPTGDPHGGVGTNERLLVRVEQLIHAYRSRGHLHAATNPFGVTPGKSPELEPQFWGFSAADLQQPVYGLTDNDWSGATLAEIIERLQAVYCGPIGIEFMHIDDVEIRRWLQARFEALQQQRQYSVEVQRRILRGLTQAWQFEDFIRRKYIGAKSFSLEGAESLIPFLNFAIEHAGLRGVHEVVMAMAHRGRLNVLANILDKVAHRIFLEFEDKFPERYRGRGDVKYHLGNSSDRILPNGQRVHLTLCFNPSHLEFVNAVALGRTRAKRERDSEKRDHMALLIHGDAAFIGEGVVQETLNLANLPGYKVGGTLHFIINNQLGFTTGPAQGRSGTYATDVARMLQSPIFHVNGDDVEAVISLAELAVDFRHEFQRDVFIDMYCYRRWGHNESDEPRFTQPTVYRHIDQRSSVHVMYRNRLVEQQLIDEAEVETESQQIREKLESEWEKARAATSLPASIPLPFGGYWASYQGGDEVHVPDATTGIAHEKLVQLLEKLSTIPDHFNIHKNVQFVLQKRQQMAAEKEAVDWATAELLAMASLAVEGFPVRLTGQDCERGTFSQRHAILHDQETDEQYCPLHHLDPSQKRVRIINSPLSEAGVVGFEYGYSLDYPDGLVLWEAQFGDFVNAAQVVIDQFLVSGEDKWSRLSGLVLLLPHGFEGQGPEHSSARLERFLQLCAEDNIQVVNPTTPAQYFHVLRRQVIRPWRKPLIVMTPKSLLRKKECVSRLADFTSNRFMRILDDATPQAEQVSRILLCSGKLYYDLLEARAAKDRQDVAIVRLEQYYPFPWEGMKRALAPYRPEVPVFWVQEEPFNMGAWDFLRLTVGERLLDRRFTAITRPASASPATGSYNSHKIEQQELIDQAFQSES